VSRQYGFVLGELLIFVVALTVLSVWLLPLALEERQQENERHAREYLRLISSSEQVWNREIGTFVDLRRLAEAVPSPEQRPANLRTPGLAFQPPMVFDGQGIAHRGGYRFRIGVDDSGRASGCWAWPNLRDYSGRDTYWIDFDGSQVWISPVDASWNDTPGSLAPDRPGLRPASD
jgi:hypothetical protein